MNRLESMISRLITQRACIQAAAGLVAPLPGCVLEIGLGKGRTYSYMRQVFAGREIYAFDREVHALTDATPPDDCLVLGDFRETLSAMAKRQQQPAALAHADIGSDDRPADAALAQAIADPIVQLVVPQGIVLSDRALPHPRLRQTGLPPIELPAGLEPWPYFMYRVAAR